MTLKRLLSFYRRTNRSRYAARISRPIIARRVATRPERGTSSLQAPPDTWPRTQNANLVFNRVASLQQGEILVSLQTEDHVWVKQESCVSTLTESRLFNKVRVTSPLDVRVSSTLDEVSQRNMTVVSTRPVFSLYFCNQFKQCTGKSSWQSLSVQQYTDNQLRVPMRSGLRIRICTMIISDGFKEFNSTRV